MQSNDVNMYFFIVAFELNVEKWGIYAVAYSCLPVYL
jgi:hypothetical protein